jgi:hypothetical protein
MLPLLLSVKKLQHTKARASNQQNMNKKMFEREIERKLRENFSLAMNTERKNERL